MKDTSQKALRRGHNEGNIRRRTDGRWEVRLSAGIDYKTGKPKRTSTCCNTRQEAIDHIDRTYFYLPTQQDFPQKFVPDVEKLNIRDGLILCFFRPAR